ncbi:homoserine O-acetyltransferase [Cyathus striatus]|nr:homoserine O-acetyltransferase [Cyathus striatus]
MSSLFSTLIDQSIYTVPAFTLECGIKLKQAPIAYKTWGKLNDKRDNVMIICHAFTGSADVEDWWGPLMGRGKAFDPSRYFIFCANVLGSPYGSASPVTINPDTGKPYGPEFPPTSIRDDVRLHKLVLDHLGVTSVAVVIGGSMGGMAVLEWPLCTPEGYVRHIIPIATSARHSAWCISWGEAQRQSIYSDPAYRDGYYTEGEQPKNGLGAARMAALLTYRSRDSFESRFGRAQGGKGTRVTGKGGVGVITPPASPKLGGGEEALAAHNDGLRNAKPSSSPDDSSKEVSEKKKDNSQLFNTQSYLRYQGDKFTARFDANCYIHITRKLDTHDVARGRSSSPSEDSEADLPRVLAMLPPRALVISIATDGLFTPLEQRELAAHIPQADLVTIPSLDGHDGFLLEFEAINKYILEFLRRESPELYIEGQEQTGVEEEGFEVKKESLFGEAEVDVVRW